MGQNAQDETNVWMDGGGYGNTGCGVFKGGIQN